MMPEPVRGRQSTDAASPGPRRSRAAPLSSGQHQAPPSRPAADPHTLHTEPAGQTALWPGLRVTAPARHQVTQLVHTATSGHQHQPAHHVTSVRQEARRTFTSLQEASPNTSSEARRVSDIHLDTHRSFSHQEARRTTAGLRDAHRTTSANQGAQHTTFDNQEAQRTTYHHQGVQLTTCDHQGNQHATSDHQDTSPSNCGSHTASAGQHRSHSAVISSDYSTHHVSNHRGQPASTATHPASAADVAEHQRTNPNGAGRAPFSVRLATAGRFHIQAAAGHQTPPAAAGGRQERAGGRPGAHVAAGAGQRAEHSAGPRQLTEPAAADRRRLSPARTGQQLQLPGRPAAGGQRRSPSPLGHVGSRRSPPRSYSVQHKPVAAQLPPTEPVAVTRQAQPASGYAEIEPSSVTQEARHASQPVQTEPAACETNGVHQSQTDPAVPIVTETAPAAASAPDTTVEDADGDVRNSMGFQITSITLNRADAGGDADADADEWADAGDESADEDAPETPSHEAAGSAAARALLASPAASVAEVLPVIPTADGFGITLVPGAVEVAAGGGAGALVQLPSAREMDLMASAPPRSAAAAGDWQSRFKVVKIETNVPFKCGRWQCMDYHDQPKPAVDVSAVPELIPAEEALPPLQPAEWPPAVPTPAPSADEMPRRASEPSQPPPPPLEEQTGQGPAGQQGLTMPDLLPGSSLLELVRSAVGDGPSQNSASPGGSSLDNKIEPIDNKIEQAMDLVKSHLLLAVREEVDVLKANISKLVDKISVLERENEVLKTNASPEVLAQLEERSPAPPSTGH